MDENPTQDPVTPDPNAPVAPDPGVGAPEPTTEPTDPAAPAAV